MSGHRAIQYDPDGQPRAAGHSFTGLVRLLYANRAKVNVVVRSSRRRGQGGRGGGRGGVGQLGGQKGDAISLGRLAGVGSVVGSALGTHGGALGARPVRSRGTLLVADTVRYTFSCWRR